jgi:hypothetical protein
LLGGLAGDAEPGADLGPGIAVATQALDHLGDSSVDLLGQAEHEDQGLDVAVPNTAAVGALDAPNECGVLASFSTGRRRRFGVNPALTVLGLASWATGDELADWVTAQKGLVGRFC